MIWVELLSNLPFFSGWSIYYIYSRMLQSVIYEEISQGKYKKSVFDVKKSIYSA